MPVDSLTGTSYEINLICSSSHAGIARHKEADGEQTLYDKRNPAHGTCCIRKQLSIQAEQCEQGIENSETQDDSFASL
jgi:hypothetical protein